MVINTLFNHQVRKFRVRKRCRHRKKHKLDKLTESLENYLRHYKNTSFCFSVRSLLSLLGKCMVWTVFQNWVTGHEMPIRIHVFFQGLDNLQEECLLWYCIGCRSELEG